MYKPDRFRLTSIAIDQQTDSRWAASQVMPQKQTDVYANIQTGAVKQKTMV